MVRRGRARRPGLLAAPRCGGVFQTPWRPVRLVSQPTPVADFQWTDLGTAGLTDMGKALRLVAEQLRMPPVLVLLSDGQPTDDFASGLAALMQEPWGMKAVRMAIAIGTDADTGGVAALHRPSGGQAPAVQQPRGPGAAYQMGLHRRAQGRLRPTQPGRRGR